MTSAVDRYSAGTGDTAYCGHEKPSTTDETYDMSKGLPQVVFFHLF